jgi:hypothetical protein
MVRIFRGLILQSPEILLFLATFGENKTWVLKEPVASHIKIPLTSKQQDIMTEAYNRNILKHAKRNLSMF